tara:strand:+ start:1410 stop:1694 length:285 start_codon:yes stop_codon:yes gene_type:complete
VIGRNLPFDFDLLPSCHDGRNDFPNGKMLKRRDVEKIHPLPATMHATVQARPMNQGAIEAIEQGDGYPILRLDPGGLKVKPNEVATQHLPQSLR